MLASLHFVMCDECGVPASEPVEADQARSKVPATWRRMRRIHGPTRRMRWIDLCPACSSRPPREGWGAE